MLGNLLIPRSYYTFFFFPGSPELLQIPNSTLNPGDFPKNDFEIFIGVPVFKVDILVFSKVKIIVRYNKLFRRTVPFGRKEKPETQIRFYDGRNSLATKVKEGK